VDYVLLVTFLCFFIFSSSVAANEKIAAVLKRAVAGNEYWWAIGLSQIISNVPASIVLYPFTENFAGLIYGADTAGLCSLIGSLASVINYRIYVREYLGRGGKFVKTFTLVSWAFFLIVVIPGLLLSRWPFF
jgi:Na+/H+ antiporter NhaD/arsenite permease-like protein